VLIRYRDMVRLVIGIENRLLGTEDLRESASCDIRVNSRLIMSTISQASMSRQSGHVETEDRSVPQVCLNRRAWSRDAPRHQSATFYGKNLPLAAFSALAL
jgi:hypothetical protein